MQYLKPGSYFCWDKSRMPSEDEGSHTSGSADSRILHILQTICHIQNIPDLKTLSKSNLIFFFLSDKGFWGTTKKKTWSRSESEWQRREQDKL